MALPRKHQIHGAYKAHPALYYRPPSPLRKIRRGLLVIVAVLAFSMVYVIYWVGAAYYFSQTVTGWLEAHRDAGYQVDFGDYRFSGFPVLFRLDFKNPSFAAPNAPNAQPPWAWRGVHAVAESSPWSPLTLSVRAPGEHSLDITQDGETVTYAGSIGELTAVLPLGGSWPPQGKLTIRDLDMRAEGGVRVAVRRAVVDIKRLGGSGADPQTPTVRFALDAGGVTAPAAFALPFGDSIAQLFLEGQILGYIEPGPAPESLARWRDAGGVLEISRLNVNYGPLNMWSAGAMALDPQLQPIGAFTAKVKGFFEAVSRLRKAGLINGKAALTATVMLGAMARKSKEGGPSTLNLAFTIQDRKIYAGPAPLAEVPAIPWKKEVPGVPLNENARVGQ